MDIQAQVRSSRPAGAPETAHLVVVAPTKAPELHGIFPSRAAAQL